jgi:ribosomal protein S18 acetylase RimI-like enzyme
MKLNLISQVLKDTVSRSDKYRSATDSEIAEVFKISASAYSNYKENKRVPDSRTAKKMAREWSKAHGEIEKAQDLENRLKSSVAEDPRQFFSRLMRGDLKLKVRTLDFGQFKTFFENVFKRYAKQVGVDIEELVRDSSEDLQDALAKGDAHLALCSFDVISRLLWARFLVLYPIRISLSAVGLFPGSAGGFSEEIRDLAEVISLGGGTAKVDYAPIVVAGGAGELHCRHKLDMNPQRLSIVHTLDPSVIASKMREVGKTSDERPVFIGDEYTCVRVLSELKYDGRLLFPLNTRSHSSQIPVCRELPQYMVSIAVSRAQKDFRDFLQESLLNFIGREVHTIAHAAAKAYVELEHEILAATKYMYRWDPEKEVASAEGTWRPTSRLESQEAIQIAQQYCRYALHLDEQSISSSSPEIGLWVPILRRAQEIIFTTMSSRKLHCCDPKNPKEAPVVKDVLSLLKELSAQFSAMGATKSVAEVEAAGRDLKEYGSRTRVFLAYEGRAIQEPGALFVGMLWLTSDDKQHQQSDACNLRYLWVNPFYRGQRIGRALVQEALRYARSQNLERAYVEILPSLEHAVQIFREAGFKPDRHHDPQHDGLLFELPLTPELSRR